VLGSTRAKKQPDSNSITIRRKEKVCRKKVYTFVFISYYNVTCVELVKRILLWWYSQDINLEGKK
jgi:hypothetical protein